jgi:hypothetical protein
MRTFIFNQPSVAMVYKAPWGVECVDPVPKTLDLRRLGSKDILVESYLVPCSQLCICVGREVHSQVVDSGDVLHETLGVSPGEKLLFDAHLCRLVLVD